MFHLWTFIDSSARFLIVRGTTLTPLGISSRVPRYGNPARIYYNHMYNFDFMFKQTTVKIVHEPTIIVCRPRTITMTRDDSAPPILVGVSPECFQQFLQYFSWALKPIFKPKNPLNWIQESFKSVELFNQLFPVLLNSSHDNSCDQNSRHDFQIFYHSYCFYEGNYLLSIWPCNHRCSVRMWS